MKKGKRYLVSLFISALLVGLGAAAGMAANVTITGTQVGTSELSIGGTEGCGGWNINDIVELGANNIRFWAGMSRVEPEDDDGVYGSPTIAEIKADPNVIPWDTWDYWFKYYDTYFWAIGCPHVEVVLYDQLTQLRDNGIRPIVTLRNVDNNDMPAWAMELNPPNTPEDWNEWWEFCFAWVYYANVLNNLDIHDWQVHNEPENASQGWDGTLEDYIVFTQYTYDAIKYVYDTYLPGESFRLYAPVAQHPKGEWVLETIKQNDDIVDVVDVNMYRPWNLVTDVAPIIHGWIDTYDTDGVHEMIHISEWGIYRGSYDSILQALKWGGELIWHSNLFDYPDAKIEMSSIFSLYNWDTMPGIIEGIPPETPTKTETYYAFRLIIRGLQDGRPMYGQVEDYANQVVNAKASDGTLYVILQAGNKAADITLDVSAHVSSGTATFYEYSANYKDEVIGTANLNNGIVNFTVPKSSFFLVEIPTI